MIGALKNYKILLLVELLILIILIPGCFRKSQLYGGGMEQIHSIGTNEDGNQVYVSEYMELPVGVYQLRAQLHIPDHSVAVLGMQAENGSHRAFRCNEVVAFSGQKYVDFEAYVLEKTEYAYVNIVLQGTDIASVDSIEIYKTAFGNRMAVFTCTFIFILLDLLLLFRDGIRNGNVKKEQQLVVWVLLLCIGIVYLPYATDYYNLGADSAFHMLRIEGLKETLLNGGQFPVRVQSNWLYDHGYAVSTFYSDFFIFIPALLRIIGFSLMTSYKLFVLFMTVATAVIAYSSFKSCTKDTYAALFGSMMYVLAPYRVYNVFNRGAVGEYLAMVFLPMVICGMYHIFMDDINDTSYSRHKYWIILGLTGILQCHLLTCEMTGGFILLACLVLVKKTLRKQTFVQLVQAAGITLLLNAWFWIPLLYMMGADKFWFHRLTENSIQSTGTWLAGVFQLYPNVGARQTGMYNAEPIMMGIASLLICIVVFTIVIVKTWKKGCKKETVSVNRYERTVTFFTAMAIVAWFLSTRYFPWDSLAQIPGIRTLVTALQFPTRLLSPVSAFCGMQAAFFLLWLREESPAWSMEHEKHYLQKGIISGLVILMVGSTIYHVNSIVHYINPVFLYTAENMGTVSVVNGEYYLEGMNKDTLCYHDPIGQGDLIWYDYTKKGTNVSVYVENNAYTARTIDLPLLGYLGYKAKGVSWEGDLPYIADERGEHGDLRIIIPSGSHGYLQVQYEELPVYLAADVISLVTLFAGIIILFLHGKNKMAERKSRLEVT